MRHALPVLVRLLTRGNRVAASWQAAAPELTSTRFWTRYLGRPGSTGSDPIAEARRPSTRPDRAAAGPTST